MYPDLSYIFHDFFGTQPDNFLSIVKTFGLLLVIAILVAAFMLSKELLRKEKEGLLPSQKVKVTEGLPASFTELFLNGLLGFVLGFKIIYAAFNFADFQADPAGVVFSSKGNWIGGIAGAVLFALIKYYEKKQQQLPKPVIKEITIRPYQRIGDITVIAAIGGIVGAKLFALAEDFTELLKGDISFSDMISQFFSGSGMAIYGGLIVGFIAVFIYVRNKNIAPIHVMDAVAPALMVAYGVGRLGCHFSGDGDWGIINEAANPAWIPDWLWAYDYPHNVINEGVAIEGCTDWNYCTKLEKPVYPTPLYETLLSFLIGGFLWAIRKRVKIAGMLFFLYLIFNGMERFWIEKIRVNDKGEFFGISSTQAEFIAVMLMIAGAIGCFILWQRHKKKATA